MAAPTTIDAIKNAIDQLSEHDKVSLAAWMNIEVVRKELLDADDQISRGEGNEYSESNLQELFAETKASALQLLHERATKHP